MIAMIQKKILTLYRISQFRKHKKYIVMFAIDNYNFAGKRAIIRVDFNVPLNAEGKVTDDTRIRAAIPTIKKVLAGGGSVILMSHLGRPKKNPDPKYSLEQIIYAIEARLGV